MAEPGLVEDQPLPWHSEQWRQLLQSASRNHLHHALLLGGLPGIGKRQFGQALAHYLLCEQPTEQGACGHCRQCGFTRAGTHPDLRWLSPEEGSRQIRVDQVREVVAFLAHTAQQGGYKVCVIYPAERMNTQAANALLKSLEEPSGQTLLMLITDAPSRLLATIRSRCQSVSLATPAAASAEAWLHLQLPEADAVAGLLAEFPGQPVRALAHFQSGELGRYQQWDRDWLALMQGAGSAVSVAQDWQQYEPTDILQWLSRRLAALVSAQTAGGEPAAGWGVLRDRVPAATLFRLLDQIHTLNQQLSGGANPNKQLALENLLLISCDKFHI